MASENGHVEIVTALLKAGAEVNAADTLGQTPMMSAAHYGHIEIVQILREHGGR